MNVAALPFNALIGLVEEPPESGLLVSLPAGPQYTNHLGSVHAAALLAVAEAGSGVFMLRTMGPAEGFIPVVRRLEAKFRKPAQGRISARCLLNPETVAGWLAERDARGRVFADVPIEVLDESGTVAMTATVEWFIARTHPAAISSAGHTPSAT